MTLVADYHALLTSDTPLLDVRAGVEYLQGAVPQATNLPILDDEQRHQVGLCYKQQGPEAAEALGHELVSGSLRADRIAAWQAFVTAHPEAVVYCFRGGKRSQLAQQWLAAAGTRIPRVDGGYKALRRYLAQSYEALPPLLVVAGRTGTGKTQVLQGLPRRVDLEQRANHRGSAFGRQLDEQPVQASFENAVAVDFLKLRRLADHLPVAIEDEGRMIGRISLPPVLQAAMKAAPLVLLEDSLEQRTQRIHAEYVLEHFQALKARLGPVAAHQAHASAFLSALDAIRKRLGGVMHQELRTVMVQAFAEQTSGDFSRHQDWIAALLERYYDPMYDYQLKSKADRIIFKGDFSAVTDYLKQACRPSG